MDLLFPLRGEPGGRSAAHAPLAPPLAPLPVLLLQRLREEGFRREQQAGRGGRNGTAGRREWASGGGLGGLGQLARHALTPQCSPLSPLVLAPLVLTPLQRFTDAGQEIPPGGCPAAAFLAARVEPHLARRPDRKRRVRGRGGGGRDGRGLGGRPGGPLAATSRGRDPRPLLSAPASPSDAELDSHPPTCLARGLAAPRRAPGSAGRGAGCGPGMGGGRNSEADSSPLRRRSPPPPPHNPPANKYPRRKRRAVPDFAPSGCVSTTQTGSRAGWLVAGREGQGAGQGGRSLSVEAPEPAPAAA